MNDTNQRMLILGMIEEGRITAEEGLELLQMLNGESDAGPDEQDTLGAAFTPSRGGNLPPWDEEGLPPPAPSFAAAPGAGPQPDPLGPSSELGPQIRKWKRWWMVPLSIGVGFIVFGGVFMYQAQQSAGVGLWFLCASLPFALGVVLIVLAYQNRGAPWLHLRIRQRPGQTPERLAFSFPIPFRQAAWLSRIFGDRIPGMSGQDLEQAIQAVSTGLTPENPFFIQVDEPRSGQKVEIYLG